MAAQERAAGTPEAAAPAGERWGALAAFLAATFYLCVAAWLVVFTFGPALVLRWDPVLITSGSMEPVVRTGDAVLLQEPADPAALAPGTVVAFDDPARPGSLTLHRIVGVHADGSYRTKGDANVVPDSTPIPPERIVGVGRLLVPVVGLPAHWLRTSPLLAVAWLVVSMCAVLLATTPPAGTAPARGASEAGSAWGSPARRRLREVPGLGRVAVRWAGVVGRIPATLRPAAVVARVAQALRPAVPAVRSGRVWADDRPRAPRAPARRRLRELSPPVAALVLPPAIELSRLSLLLAAVLGATVLLLDPRGPELRVGRWRRDAGRVVRRASLSWAALSRALVCSLALVAVLAPMAARGLTPAAATFAATTTDGGGTLRAGDWGACRQGGSTTVHAVADAAIDEAQPATPLGGGPVLAVTRADGATARTLLRFPLPALGQGCAFDHATLRLHATSSSGARPVTVSRLVGGFDETTVTWATRPSEQGPSAHSTIGGAGWVEVNVAGPVGALYASGGGGLAIRDEGQGTGSHVFVSREGDPSLAPQLVVRWR
jgi:signal peptidase I